MAAEHRPLYVGPMVAIHSHAECQNCEFNIEYAPSAKGRWKSPIESLAKKHSRETGHEVYVTQTRLRRICPR